MISDNNGNSVGGIANYYSNLTIINSTIVNNLFNDDSGTCSLQMGSGANTVIINSIIWNENSPTIKMFSFGEEVSLVVTNSDIKDGETGIIVDDDCFVYWLGGNISENPEFIDNENQDYHLSENSPCIDAGTDYFVWNDLMFEMSADEYYGTAPDMGVYEYQSVHIQNEELEIRAYKLSNYPNPFHSSTTISFSITAENTENAEINIYNIKGQKIKTFKNLQIDKSPNQQIVWDGKDESGHNVCSGMYFYKLSSGDSFSQTKKMILMK